MAGFVYFGTRERMQWVKAPAVNVDASNFGYQSKANYLNGGAYIRRSWGSHKEYSLTWNLSKREELRPIVDYASGVYGQGLVYWMDPFAADVNLLPEVWSNSYLGLLDGPILDGKATTRPVSTTTVSNTLGYPVQSATYTVGAETKPTVWIPCPPGYTLWVGSHGVDGTGGTVVATPTTGATTISTPVTLTTLPVTTLTRVNQSFDGNTYGGVLISLGGTGTITLSGLIVQVLPTGQTPATGGFLSGQGNSGCSFEARPTLTEYNAVIDRVGLSAKLTEVGAWL